MQWCYTPLMKYDLVLSSGFLAFARHIGVLRALQNRQVEIEAVVGTSSGALVGALWAAGHDADQICQWLQERRPISLMRPHLRPWRGLLSLQPLVQFLRQRLPPNVEDLPLPFAVGVIDLQGQHRLLTEGDLACAVAASCAMPWIFASVEVQGERFEDGGAADRLAVEPWRRWRPGRQAIAHQVQRTAGKDLNVSWQGVMRIQTPRSGASFWSLGDVMGQSLQAETLALEVLQSLASESAE